MPCPRAVEQVHLAKQCFYYLLGNKLNVCQCNNHNRISTGSLVYSDAEAVMNRAEVQRGHA